MNLSKFHKVNGVNFTLLLRFEIFKKILDIRPVNEWGAIALAHPHTCQYLLRCATVAPAKLYMTS